MNEREQGASVEALEAASRVTLGVYTTAFLRGER